MSPVRVLAVDDHPIVLEGLKRFAETEPRVAIVATSPTLEGLGERMRDVKPDVLSLDVQVPGMRGPETIRELATHGIPILLFTLHRVDEALGTLVKAGAEGYLAKSSGMAAYVDAVLALAAGRTHLPPELEAMLDRSSVVPPEELLTPRELQVFEGLAKGEAIKEVAFRLGLSASTVYNHRERIREKLGVSSVAELVRQAEKWRFEAPE